MKITIIKLYLSLIIIALLSCVTDISDNTGTGHDGEMKVIGTVYTPQGEVAEGLNVRILPSGFNPLEDTLDTDLYENKTGNNGTYEFSMSDTGYYTISAFHEILQAYLYIDSVHISSEIEDQGNDTLKSATKVTIINETMDSGSLLIVYLNGTDLIIDTLFSDSSMVLIPSDTIDLNVSSTTNNSLVLLNEKVYPNDTNSDVIIIKDSSQSFSGKLLLSALGESGNIWSVNSNDTLSALLSFIDSSSDSTYVNSYSISWRGVGSNDTLWTLLDSNVFNFYGSDTLDTVIIIGSAEVVRFKNQNIIDSLTVYSDQVLIIIEDSITSPQYYIKITGRDSLFQNDTADYTINSNLDSLDTLKYEVFYNSYFKRPTDSLFKVSEWPFTNIFGFYFTDFGFYQTYVQATIIEIDSVGLNVDTSFVYSDTIDITVLSSSLLGSISLTVDKKSGILGEPFSFSISFKDTLGDTIKPSNSSYYFEYNDGTDWGWQNEPSDTHVFYSTGTYMVIGSMHADSGYRFFDTVIVSILEDSTNNDSLFPNLPNPPTGADIITINSDRYYVTEGDDYVLSNDTLQHEFRFTWNDTITDSLYSPNGLQPNVSNWDTLPYSENSWNKTGIYFVRIQKRFRQYPEKISDWSAPIYVKVFADNNDSLIDTISFKTPQSPIGDDTLAIDQVGTFITNGASCIIPGSIQYRFDWDDGTISDWSNNAFLQKKWDLTGSYLIKTQARSVTDTAALSQWSSSLHVLVNNTGRKNSK